MKTRTIVAVLLAGCGSSPPGGGMPVDAAQVTLPPDAAPTMGDPIDFDRIGSTGITFPTSWAVGAAPHELYGLLDGALQRTVDLGAHWTTVSSVPATLLVSDPAGVLYATGTPHYLGRSTDGGATFTPLTLPFPAGIGRAIATHDGALWVISPGANPDEEQLYRSVDHGDHFTQVALPVTGATYLNPFASNDGYLYLSIDNGGIQRTHDGTTWQALETFNYVTSPFAASTGTVFVSTRDAGGSAFRRSTDGGMTFDREDTTYFYTVRERPDGKLVRVSQNADVDLSSDDGMTWTPVVSGGYGIYEVAAFDEGLVAYDLTGPINLPDGATAWQRLTAPGLPLPQTADFRDITFAADGTLAVAGAHQVFVSPDQGVNWTLGAVLDSTYPIDAIAFRPDGQRIFIGSTLGRYDVLDRDAAHSVFQNPVHLGGETFRQAQWLGGASDDPSHDLLVVTSATDDDTDGHVWQAPLTDESADWRELFLFANSSAPMFHPTAGYHGVGITGVSNGNIGWFVGVREWQGTNSYGFHVRSKINQDPWDEGTNFVNFGEPLTISPSGGYGQALAWLYSDNRLFIGGFIVLSPSALNGVEGNLRSAKFAPDGRLWLVTSSGLFRSRQVFGR